jgi:hypothetical protein
MAQLRRHPPEIEKVIEVEPEPTLRTAAEAPTDNQFIGCRSVWGSNFRNRTRRTVGHRVAFLTSTVKEGRKGARERRNHRDRVDLEHDVDQARPPEIGF